MSTNQSVPIDSRPPSLILRLVPIGWGVWLLWLAAMAFIDLSMAGFPDGFLTPYDRTTNGPLGWIAWLTLAAAGYFLAWGIRGRKLTWRAAILQVAVAGLLTVLPLWLHEVCPRWGLCAQAYQAVTGQFLDDGAGG